MVKLIKQGGGGYTIYLPKKWVDRNNLTKGNELDVEESGNDLIIRPEPSEKKAETSVKLTNSSETAIRTLVTNLYRDGYDKINVSGIDENQYKMLQKIIKTRLIGFDIIKKEQDLCIIENITEPSIDQFDNLLKKFFLNIEELFDITKKRLDGTNDKLEDFEEVEERIHKYDNFCRRVIIKQKLIKKRSEMFWCFLSEINHAQRELYFLNRILDKKIKISKKTKDLFESALEIFNLVKVAFFQDKIEILWQIQEIEKQALFGNAYYQFQNLKSKENVLVYHLATCIRQLHLSTSPLSGMKM